MKKGASTAIVMILVMLITVSLILMSYQWLLKYSPQTQQELENNLYQKKGCLRIENIDTKNKKITVRNCGDSDLSNFIVYIDDKPVGNYSNKLGPGDVIQISYTGYVTAGVNHNIMVSSDYAESPIITFIKNCDVYITQSMVTNTYTIDQSDTYYCLSENIHIDGQNAIGFLSVQGSTLDCRGYNIDGNDTDGTNGVYLTGSSTSNNVITNCNITDFYHNIYLHFGSANTVSYNKISNSDNDGIRIESTDNNIIVNNIITMPKANSQGGIDLSSSNNNVISGNTITTSAGSIDGISLGSSNNNVISGNTMNVIGSTSDGIWLTGSNSNTILNNIIANKDPAHGIHIVSSNNNNITGGSVISTSGIDYYLQNTGSNNKFASTNFTAARTIYFYDSSSWFNYNNETTGNIWLKTSVSAQTSITRKLVSWSQNTMQWNDTANAQVIATYNISGLSIYYIYNVYNNSVLTYSLSSGSNGQINFTINLSAGQEQEIKIVKTSSTTPPMWFTNSTNNTIAAKPTLFSLNWTDDVGLSGYIFSTNNNGTWVNDTWTAFPGVGGIVFDKVGSANATGSGNSLSWNHQIGSGSNRMLVVITGLEDGSNVSVSSVTYNGVNLAFAGQSSKWTPSNWARSEIWYLNDSGLPSAGTYAIQVNWLSGVALAMAASISVSGVAQAPPENMTINTSEPQSYIITEIKTLTDNAWVFDAVTSGLGPTTFTQGVGQTEFADMSVGTGATTAGSYKIVDKAGITTMNETATGPSRISHILAAWAPFASNAKSSWSNVTKILNSTVGSAVQWCVYANDTSNNWNYTSCINPFSLITGTPMLIQFVSPTDNNGATVGRSWSYVNVSITDASSTSSFIDWNRSLIGYWAMDWYNSTGIFDNSTYNNFGSFSGTAFGQNNITSGKYGYGLKFDGNDDYVQIDNTNTLFNSSKPLTISFWVNLVDLSVSYNNLVCLKTDQGTGFGTFLSGGSGYEGINFGSSSNFVQRKTAGNISGSFVNNWRHVALTFDGVDRTSASSYKIYVDGVEQGITTDSSWGNLPNSNRLGSCDPTQSTWYLKGSMDEVRIFNRALSPEEINASYNSGLYRLYRNFTNLAIGSYQYYAYAIDTNGNNGKTETRTLTFGGAQTSQAPQYFQSSTNSTVAGKPTLFSLNWTDDIGLSGYIFSTNNSGVWQNDTWRDFENQSGNAKFIDGFESGDFSKWNAIVIRGLIDSTNSYSGLYSARNQVDYDFTTIGYSTPDIGNTTHFRFYAKVSTLGSSYIQLASVFMYSFGSVYKLYINSSSLMLTRYFPSVASDTWSGTFLPNTWYEFEIKATRSNPGEYRVWVNGIERITDTGVDTSGMSEPIRQFELYNAGGTYVNWDNAVISTSYIGPYNSLSNVIRTFGNNNNGGSSYTLGNNIMGKNYTIAENGISKSITARINTYGLARNVKCAIYDNSNNFVAETQENSVNTGSMAWVTFNFNSSNQRLLYANQLYHLVCWSNGAVDMSATYTVGENTYSQSATYGAWPKPYVPTILSNTNKADIYVDYTPSNALFSDGFESGNLNAWDGTAISGVGTVTVQNSLAYNGIYASNFTSMSTDAAIAYKAITPGTDYYISSYVRLSAMPTGSSQVVLGAGFAHSNSDVPSWALIAKPIVQLQGGNLYWGVRSIYGGGTSSQNYLESAPSNPSANTWYKVQMHSTVGTSGQFQLWVNGILKVNQTNIDNSARGNIGTACVLLDSIYGAQPAMNLYADDVVASTSYIGSDTGWSNATKTLNSTVGTIVQWCVYANDTSNNWNYTSCINPFSLTTSGGNDNVLNIHFNEANGTKTYDSSGYGNNGTCYGETFNDGTLGNGTAGTQPTWLSGSSCIYGRCLDFDGTGDVVNATDIPNSSLTIMAWIYPKQLAVDQRAIASKWRGPEGTSEWLFRTNGGSELTFHLNNITGLYEGPVISTSANLQNNGWYHVAVVYNRTNKQASFYVNGTPKGGGQFPYNGQTPNGTCIIRIGAQGAYTWDLFNGTIDEVRIWNRELSLAEVNSEMQSSLPVTRPTASWKFDEGSGNRANDTHIWVNGTYGSALSFDGVNDYVQIPHSSSQDITGGITIMAWIKRSIVSNNYEGILFKDSNTYGFGLYTNNKLKFTIPSVADLLSTGAAITDTTNYHHVAVVRNGTSGNWNYVFYIDGNLDSMIGDNHDLGIGSGGLTIGAEWGGSTSFFNGTIDEVRVWNRALSLSEIQAEKSKG